MTNTGEHRGFRVRGKAFACYRVDRHGDGRTTLAVRMPSEVRALVSSVRLDRASNSPGAGLHRWFDVELQERAVDWGALAALVRESYRLVAPASLGKLVAVP